MISPDLKAIVRDEYDKAKERFEETEFEYCIIHAVRAAELAVAFKMDSQINDEQKVNLSKQKSGYGMTFGALIKEARKDYAKALNEETFEIASQLNDLRGIIFHPGNLFAFTVNLAKNINNATEQVLNNKDFINRLTMEFKQNTTPKDLNWVKTHKIDFDTPRREHREQFKYISTSIPSLEWTAKLSSLELQRDYFRKTVEKSLTAERILKMSKELKSLEGKDKERYLTLESLSDIDYMGVVAEDTLRLTEILLDKLGFTQD